MNYAHQKEGSYIPTYVNISTQPLLNPYVYQPTRIVRPATAATTTCTVTSLCADPVLSPGIGTEAPPFSTNPLNMEGVNVEAAPPSSTGPINLEGANVGAGTNIEADQSMDGFITPDIFDKLLSFGHAGGP